MALYTLRWMFNNVAKGSILRLIWFYLVNMVLTKKRILALGMGVTVIGALVFLAVSLATNFWHVITETRVNTTGIYITFRTHGGLFGDCIEYESARKLAKPKCDLMSEKLMNMGMVKASCVFPACALVATLLGAAVSILGRSNNNKQITLILLSALIFVLSGLFIMTGIVIYITRISSYLKTLEDNAAQSVQSETSSETFVDYFYGWSFYLAITSFLLVESAAVISIYSYTDNFRREIKKRKCLQQCKTQLQSGANPTPTSLDESPWQPPGLNRDFSLETELTTDDFGSGGRWSNNPKGNVTRDTSTDISMSTFSITSPDGPTPLDRGPTSMDTLRRTTPV